MLTSEKQIKNLQKEIENLTSKIKFYEENYIKSKLDAIQFSAKLNMQAVFRQINEIGDNKYKTQMGSDDANVTTLKDAVIICLNSV